MTSRSRESKKAIQCKNSKAGGLGADGYQAIRDLCQIQSFHFPRLLAIVAAESVTGNLEPPGTKECAISNLRSFAVNDQHYFLRQVFGQRQLTTARPEEGDELRCKCIKQVGKRIVVRDLQKHLSHCPFMEESLICDRLVAHLDSAPLWLRLHKGIRAANPSCG